jgi:hypothetical protein
MKALLLSLVFAVSLAKAQDPCGLVYSPDTTLCGEGPHQLFADGGVYYNWWLPNGGGSSIVFHGAHFQQTVITPTVFVDSVSTNYALGTYTIKLMYQTPACQQTQVTYLKVKVIECATGIPEYQITEKPIYFNLQGQIVQPVPGELLIEQRGRYRCKIIIQN